MRRSLIYFWRTNLAVTLGAAVACAVLTGALLVGDSVRGSLRDLTLARLGQIDLALIGERPFGQRLGERLDARLDADLRIEPVLMLRAAARHGETRARASDVALLGVEPDYADLYPAAPGGDGGLDAEALERRLFPSVVLNRALAEELGAAVGDQILISFERPSEIPRETLVGRQDADETVRVLRLEVSAVIADRGPGGFALTPHQTRPLNAFVDRRELQRALFGRGGGEQVNLLLAAVPDSARPAPTSERLQEALAAALRNDDLGLFARRRDGHLTVMSEEFVLRPRLGEAILGFADEHGAAAQPVLTYLANSISGGGRSTPYSTVSALDPPPAPELGPFRLVDGSPAPALADDEILLNAWTADDLGVEPGAEIELTYYVVGARDELSTATATFTLAGVVAMEGLAVDPDLTPAFPGMHEADDISAWDPPFPVDLERIRDRDEAYWDDYRAAPKAFVAEAVGRRLWRSRFGDLTSVRLAPGGGESVAELEAELHTDLARQIDPEAAGFRIRELREEGLRRSRGATDFAALFLGLSMFLIASAAMLVGLLFRLGVEQRAPEVGLLRAVGHRARSVRRRLLGEGAVLAAIGGLLGLLLALLYAWAMLVGLRTWWLPAVGTPVLFLHVEPLSLAIGWLASLAVVLLSIWWSLRRLHKVPAPALLAGSTEPPRRHGRPRLALPVALVSGAAAVVMVLVAWLTGNTSSPALAFGIGGALLVGGIAWTAWRIGGGRRRANALGGAVVVGMGARNSGRNRSRSLLSVALVACACFIVVVVAANRVEEEIDVEKRSSGAGGFTLIAESEVALLEDLGTDEARRELGLTAEESGRLAGVELVPFRLLPGEDVSCLNLYRPERPRVLGVPDELIERGGFTFQQTIEEVGNPWTLLRRELEPGVVPAIADNNSALWILHLGLGEDVMLEDESGRELRLRLVGLLRQSVFQSEVLIAESRFTEHFPSRTGYSVFLADAPAERAEDVAELLESSLEPFGFDATGTEERIASFLAVENTYLSTFQTLGGLGLILGTVGLGIVLLRSVLERRGELATLRAFGYRRSTLSWMVLAENGVLLVTGIVIGTAAGLVASTPHLLSGGSELPWGALLVTLAVVFLVGMLASVLAVAGTLRVPLLPALKAE